MHARNAGWPPMGCVKQVVVAAAGRLHVVSPRLCNKLAVREQDDSELEAIEFRTQVISDID